MAAHGAFFQKLGGLLLVNESALQQRFDSGRIYRPSFALGEGLLQEVKVRERVHRVDTLVRQLRPEILKFKPSFEMMHAGLEETISVESTPESYGSQNWRVL